MLYFELCVLRDAFIVDFNVDTSFFFECTSFVVFYCNSLFLLVAYIRIIISI